MMDKKLPGAGNSLGLVIERPISELRDLTKDPLLEIETEGEAIMIRPVKEVTEMERVLAAAAELMDAHDETYRKLAK